MAEIEVSTKAKFSPAEIERGLLTLAITNSPKAAAALLKEQGIIDPSERTLRSWRQKYNARYMELCERHRADIEKALVVEQMDLAKMATAAAMEAVALERQRIADGSVRDAAASGRNMATVAGIAVDKILNLEGRPTSIVQHKSGEQALRSLSKYGKIIESTAEEVVRKELGNAS